MGLNNGSSMAARREITYDDGIWNPEYSCLLLRTSTLVWSFPGTTALLPLPRLLCPTLANDHPEFLLLPPLLFHVLNPSFLSRPLNDIDGNSPSFH